MDSRLLHSNTSSFIFPPYQKIKHQRKISRFRPVMSVIRPSNHKLSPELTKDTTKTVYRDSWLHLMAINHVSRTLQAVAGIKIEKVGYDGLLEACKALTTKFNKPVQQRELSLESLNRLIPTQNLFYFGQLMALLSHTKQQRELFALCATLFFVWLVGSSEVRESEFNGRREKNVAHIKKCRFLESSNCVGMCTNLCKFPTQKFIKEALGMPVTMVPNFEDMSCEMIFGLEPPPADADSATTQPCYKLCELSKRQQHNIATPANAEDVTA